MTEDFKGMSRKLILTHLPASLRLNSDEATMILAFRSLQFSKMKRFISANASTTLAMDLLSYYYSFGDELFSTAVLQLQREFTEQYGALNSAWNLIWLVMAEQIVVSQEVLTGVIKMEIILDLTRNLFYRTDDPPFSYYSITPVVLN